MRCPRLRDLPPPPPTKHGWPWTEESPQLPDTMPDGSPWPKISIVTPSLDQSQFIEETIRSILLQGYPDLEYIIVDGGSTDGSLDIIRKYKPWLAYQISEPDHGQSDAINKGLMKSRGGIFGWLNSDDIYLPTSLLKVALNMNPKLNRKSICGNLAIIDSNSILLETITREYSVRLHHLFSPISCPQPACFWDRSAVNLVGILNETMHYVFDLEYWIRTAMNFPIYQVHETLAALRHHQNAKTFSKALEMHLEKLEMYRRLYSSYNFPPAIKRNKRTIFRHINEQIAFLYMTAHDNLKAKKYFLRSIFSDPLRYQNMVLLLYALQLHTESRHILWLINLLKAM